MLCVQPPSYYQRIPFFLASSAFISVVVYNQCRSKPGAESAVCSTRVYLTSYYFIHLAGLFTAPKLLSLPCVFTPALTFPCQNTSLIFDFVFNVSSNLLLELLIYTFYSTYIESFLIVVMPLTKLLTYPSAAHTYINHSQ